MSPVEVLDLAEELSAADEQFLRDRTPGLNLAAEGGKWAPGALIVAVGRDPQRMGGYCRDDVCDAVDMYAPGRLDRIHDRMRTPRGNGNLAAGLFEGAKATADPTAATIGFGAAGMVLRHTRRRQATIAREQFAEAQHDYGRLAGELQAIDVRAHSLTSPLTNDTLRRQWEDVKTGFLGLDITFDQLEGLSSNSSDKDFRGRRKAVATAHEQVMRLRTAEENIEQLAQMEHGDADVRRKELTDLHEDVLRAVAGVEDVDLKNRLELLDGRVLVKAAPEGLYEKSGTEKHSDSDHHAPALWDSGWRPGYGYGN